MLLRELFSAGNGAEDVILADLSPQSFAFGDFFVCALLLLRREELLRHGRCVEALAEELLAVTRAVPLAQALRLAQAMRALEKQTVKPAKVRVLDL